jgi:hypothetical protein
MATRAIFQHRNPSSGPKLCQSLLTLTAAAPFDCRQLLSKIMLFEISEVVADGIALPSPWIVKRSLLTIPMPPQTTMHE